MVIDRFEAWLVAVVILLGQSAFAAEPDPANEPLPEGAKVRFGVTRPILQHGPSVGLMPPTFGVFLAPTKTGGVRRYDLGTGRPLDKQGVIGAGQVIVSDNGKRAAVSRQGGLTIVEVSTGEELMVVQPPEGIVFAGTPGASLSADGKIVAYGGRSKENTGCIVVCNVETKQVLSRCDAKLPPPVFPMLSRDGSTLIAHGPPAQAPIFGAPAAPAPLLSFNTETERTAALWDTATGKELRRVRLTGMGGTIVSAAFSPDGKLVAVSAGDGPIDLFDVKTGQRKKTFLGRIGQGVKLAMAPDGKTIASIGHDFRIQRWSIAGRPLEATSPPAGVVNATISGLTFANNERVIAWLTAQQFVIAWEAPSGNLLSPATEHIAGIRSISFAKGDAELYTAGHDGRVLRWNQSNGRLLETITLQPGKMPGQPSVTPVVLLSADAARAIWTRTPPEAFDMASGGDLYCVPPPSTPQGQVNAFVSNDGTKVTTISRKARNDRAWSCVIWDAMTEERVGEFDVPAPAVASMPAALLSPRNERVLFGYMALNANKKQVMVNAGFDIKTGKKLAEVEDANVFGQIGGAAADETTAVLASSAGRLWYVDFAKGRVGDDIDNLPTRPDSGSPYVVFSPDGKRFAVSIPGNEPESYGVRLYDWQTKKALHTFTGHRGPINMIRFSPDGKCLATGSQDTSVLLWDLSKLPAKK